ncbi:histidine phosphatase family protein [Trueperella sp. LYQ143]|uniref:histidine phosphatase family protein n=1 Tax=unclassified Trueperella TaxID=2630174 RepID=UPI003983CAA0
MAVRRIILWRHGQTALNVGRRIQGSQDHELDDRGHTQAQEAAGELALAGITHIVSSPLVRARDTAEYLAHRIGVEVLCDERIQERCFGCWEGMTSPEIRAAYPLQWEQWRESGDPQGLDIETREECGQRVAAAVTDWVTRFDADEEEQTLVFVSHGAAISTGITTLLGLNPSLWHGIRGMDNCRWATLIPSSGGWKLCSYNETSYRPAVLADTAR